MRRGNENNEQRGLRQSGSCPTGPHCTMGHGTGRQAGHKGPSLPGLLALRGEREREGGEQRAAMMMMDEGAEGRSQWTGLKAGVRLVVRG